MAMPIADNVIDYNVFRDNVDDEYRSAQIDVLDRINQTLNALVVAVDRLAVAVESSKDTR